MIKHQDEILSLSQNIPLLRLFHSVVSPFKRDYIQHHHTAFEISMICSGSGIYTTNRRVYRFHPHDIFLFSSNEVHCITQIDEGEDLDIMNLQFEPRFIWSPGNDLFDSKYLNIFFNRSENFEHKLDRDDENARILQQLMLETEREFTDKLVDYELMVKVKLLTILVTISRNFNYVADIRISPVKTQHLLQLENALAYIDSNLSSDIDLDTIARTANMSRSYFSTIFKEMNGISPWEYIVNKRIELSIHYLTTTDRSILEIACMCGFNSTANFNHAFKKVTMKSPSDFRRP